MPNARVNEQYVEMRQHEMLRRAEQHRLIPKAQHSRYTLVRAIVYRMRSWFGRGMVAAGRGLQKQGTRLQNDQVVMP